MMPHAPNPLSEITMALRMAVSSRKWTRRDLQRLPDDGNRYEVVYGELFVTPAPRRPHQNVVTAISRQLAPFLLQHDLGWLDGPRSVVVIGGNEVEPDLMVRPKEATPARTWEKAPLPILVIEVLSDVTKRRDRVTKRALYMDAGIPEYWIVDGERMEVTVCRPGEADRVVRDRLVWQPPGPTASLEISIDLTSGS